MSKVDQPNRWVAAVISTYEDLRDIRSAVRMWLSGAGFDTQLFEEPGFPVDAGKKAHEACLAAINDADIVILIVDKRYGRLFLGEGPYSITEQEYHQAITADKVVIPCVRQAAWEDYQALEEGRLREEAPSRLSPRYVEEPRVFDLLRQVTRAPHDDFLVRFNTVSDLLQKLEGRVAGLSRSLCCWIVGQQVNEVMGQKTTTALAFSLGDVLLKGYFVQPPYQLVSGAIPENLPAVEVLRHCLASGRSALVLGEPGSGKTTVVAKAFLDSAKSFKDSRSNTVPLYVNLRGRGASYRFGGTHFIEECCAQYFQKGLLPLFDIRRVKPVYFMDGLDELTEDVTALNIDQVAEADMFAQPFVMSCRSRFAEDALVSLRFGDRVDVVVRMTDWEPQQTWRYVKSFFEIRHRPDLSTAIERAYKDSGELADVLHNPLLLTLFLWIVEEPGVALPLDIRDHTSVVGEVVRLLVNREIARTRPGDSPGRAWVMRSWQLAAWELYRARVEEEEITVRQLQERVAASDANAAPLTGLPIFLDLLDTNPRSGCVRGMVHEVLWEYLVGSALVDGMKENRYPFPECLEYLSRVEINRLVRELWTMETETTRRDVVARLKDALARDLVSTDQYASLRRNQAAYYIGRMPLKGIAEELKALDRTERDVHVKLSLEFSLVKLGDFDTEEALWRKLDRDENWDSHNRGYYLVYLRDRSAVRNPPPFVDEGTSRWDRTFAALFRHLTSEDYPRHVALRRLDLLTMRRFIVTRQATGPLGVDELEKIRASMEDTRSRVAGFKKGVLDEFKRLFDAWKAAGKQEPRP